MQEAGEAAQAPAAAVEPFVPPEWTPAPLLQLWKLIEGYPLLGFLLIIVLALVAGKLAEWLVSRGVRRLTAKTETTFDDRVIDLVHRPIFIAVFFLGLTLAFRSLALSPGVTRFTVRALQTLVVLVWLRAGFGLSRLVLEALSRHKERFNLIQDRTLPLFDITVKVLLLAGGSYVILAIWKINPTPWLASAGVIGIAVGFAAKDTLANLFGGFFILADAPYKIGDFIVLESGERGRVTQVGVRSTRLETRDDIEITIPNAQIANAKIINETGGRWEKERIRIKVGVAYGSDVDRVCELLETIARGHSEVCSDPAPRVRMRGLGDSSLDFELLCWIEEPVLRGSLSHQLYMEVYKALNREGIEIPYPKRDLYIRQAPSGQDRQPKEPAHPTLEDPR